MGQVARRLNEPDGVIDQTARGTLALSRSLERFNAVTLPRVEAATDATARAARQFGRMTAGVSDNPQALIYGPGAPLPGPGEAGFVAPVPAVAPAKP